MLLHFNNRSMDAPAMKRFRHFDPDQPGANDHGIFQLARLQQVANRLRIIRMPHRKNIAEFQSGKRNPHRRRAGGNHQFVIRDFTFRPVCQALYPNGFGRAVNP